MKAKFVLLALLASTAGLVVLPAQAEGNFGGSYNITGYHEPVLNAPFTYCFDFTVTGGVLGFPNSGTFNVPSYAGGWTGDWYRNGDEIIINGVAGGAFYLMYGGRILSPTKISGRQSEFFGGSTAESGTFEGVKISGSCPTADGAATGDLDPTK